MADVADLLDELSRRKRIGSSAGPGGLSVLPGRGPTRFASSSLPPAKGGLSVARKRAAPQAQARLLEASEQARNIATLVARLILQELFASSPTRQTTTEEKL